MAMVLLAIASAGVLLPFSTAAAAQIEAQRRVVAARFAADVIETLAAGQTLTTPVLPASLGYAGPAYQDMVCEIQTHEVVGFASLTYVSAAVTYQQMPMVTLKTLVGSGG